uniref:Glycosyl transferase family 25 domain-containing protein n=1 Tax=Alexandrium catenella TaxID=2925 RepID=A0A7S1SF49_ALECA|mmetsp:Transcript_98898/g.262660  ORF Transcript_98898/g.262660 Transcript_98898/m.262660 type:complete len:471 (+) Transcript_98898:118-1530(+)
MPSLRCTGSSSFICVAMAATAGLATMYGFSDSTPPSVQGHLAFTAGLPRRALRVATYAPAIGDPALRSAPALAGAGRDTDTWQLSYAAPFAGLAAALAAAVARRPPPRAGRGRTRQPAAAETEAGAPPSPPVWVVNLDKSVERWKTCQEELAANGITAERFPATLGKSMTDEELKEKTTWAARYFCTPGMIGCFMSHLRIWNRVAKEGHPAVVVFEDDIVILHKDFNSQLQSLLKELPDDWDVCLLGAVGCVAPEREPFYMRLYGLVTGGGRASPGKTRMVSPNVYVPYRPAGTHAYMVSQKGAEKLSRLCPKPQYHVDLTAWGLKELSLYAVRDQLATQRFDDDTTVSKQGAPLTKRFLRWTLDVSGLAYMGRRGGVPNLQWAWTIACFALPVPFSSSRRRLIVEMGPASALFVVMCLLSIPLRSLKVAGFALAYLTCMITIIRSLAGTHKPATFTVMALLSAAVIYYG